MDTLQRVMEGLFDLTSAIEKLDSVEYLPGFKFSIAIHDKVVFDNGDGRIIRVSPRHDGLLRVGISQYMEDNGIDCFLSEEIMDGGLSPYFVVTVQKKIDIISDESDEKILTKILPNYEEKKKEFIRDFFSKYKVQWFGSNNNCGIEDGKIKIFDYIVNLALVEHNGPIQIVDRKGEVVHNVRV